MHMARSTNKTHDKIEAMTISTRLAVMDWGPALQIDPSWSIFRRAADVTMARVAGTPTMEKGVKNVVAEVRAST